MAIPKGKPDGTEALLAAYPAAPPAAGWMNTARASALEFFRRTGVPSRRDEYWKFSDPARLTQVPAVPAGVLEADEAPVFGVIDRLRIVFVDGVLRPDLSDRLELEGVEIEPLSEAAGKDIHWAQKLYGVLERGGQAPVRRPLAALNTARAAEGVVIRATGKVARPVSLIYVHQDRASDALLHNVVRVEAGADLTLVENGPAAARFNKCLEVEVCDGGAFHHVRAQGRDHERCATTHLFARLGRNSSFKSFTLTANGVFTRNETVVTLCGDDATAHIAGACVGDGEFHHDDTVFITHDARNCESRQVYKKVLRNGATGVFQGKILVRPGAQKTDGYQISQGLLLDEDSQFLAKPELEIYADDVACSHGSTSGAVDEEALFYLTSRGVARADAQGMLVLAFLDEAIQEIEDERIAEDIRDRLAAWVARRRTD
ncbi:MAG: SufD family Fe-S cluster assembly protein [Paracoccaceae bacterium]